MRHAKILASAAAAALLLTTAACAATRSDEAARGSGGSPLPPAYGGQTFEDYGVNPEVATADDNRSTFAIDVDTGSYTFTRRYLSDGLLPDPAAVRTEEFVNYFAQDYDPPRDGIGIHLDGTSVPFLGGTGTRVVRVGLQAATVDDAERRPANLTFIVDTSGSMEGASLEMVKAGMGRLLDSLRADDRVSIVSYSDDAQLRLAMTPMTESTAIRTAVASLAPQASTNLEAGLRLGYEHALANRREDGINRVVLLSDGEANVGHTDPRVLAEQIAQSAAGTTLVVVGVGRQTYNEVVLEQFADNGNGFFAYIDTIREAERLFVHDLTGTIQVVALDAKVQVTFDPQVVSHYRLLGFENRRVDDAEFRDDSVDGGEVGAGHTVTALYQVTFPEGREPVPDAALATVDVRWTDPDTAGSAERSATLRAADLAASFDQAPVRLRQDILVAAFAESLRKAPWAELVGPGQIAERVRVLSGGMPGDADLAELAALTRAAADLAG